MRVPILAIFFCSAFFAHSQADEELSTSEKTLPALQHSATLLWVSGDVRIKKLGSSVWMVANLAQKLSPGEKIFTGLGAAAAIEYTVSNAVIRLEGSSLLRVSTVPPVLLRVDKTMQLQVGSELASLDKNLKFGDDALPGLKNLFVTKLQIQYPKLQTLVSAKSLPVAIPFVLDKIWRNEKIWAHIWKKSDPQNSVLRQFSVGNFEGVRFNQHGTYIVQLICENAQCASAPVEVKVLGAGFSKAFDQILDGPNFSDVTVVLP